MKRRHLNLTTTLYLNLAPKWLNQEVSKDVHDNDKVVDSIEARLNVPERPLPSQLQGCHVYTAIHQAFEELFETQLKQLESEQNGETPRVMSNTTLVIIRSV